MLKKVVMQRVATALAGMMSVAGCGTNLKVPLPAAKDALNTADSVSHVERIAHESPTTQPDEKKGFTR